MLSSVYRMVDLSVLAVAAGQSSCSEVLEAENLVARLQRGDEEAFDCLVERFHDPMLRFARSLVDKDESLAREVVQETWLAVINGLDRFEGRSSLKTWMFGILSNQAKKRFKKENRLKNWSALFEDVSMDEKLSVDSERFDPSGTWTKPPSSWNSNPEQRVENSEVLDVIEDAIENLPDSQQAVVVLRDVEGVSADDACDILDVTDSNQRVLLHRGRVRIRKALERYYDSGDV